MASHQVLNPATQEELFRFEYTCANSVEHSLNNLNSLGQESQDNLSPNDRYEILNRLKEKLFLLREDFAKMITEQTGKTISESFVEVERAIITVEYSAEEARRLRGESCFTNEDQFNSSKLSITTRRPLGTIFCITPFNFPLNLALHKIAPAFASGNCILYKPSDCNYLLGQKLVEICIQSGFPKHSIELICPSENVLKDVVGDPRVNCISFTGGTNTANKIATLAGRKRLILELGGNDALVVYPDADITKAIQSTLVGRFGTSGQKCSASKRIFIHCDVYEEFKQKLLRGASKFIWDPKINPMSENALVGPLISVQAADSVKKIVDDAISNGANLLLGNQKKQAYYSPTVLEDVPFDSPILTEEVFGPVLPLIKFSSDSELISMINRSRYGLQAGIFTQNISRVKQMFSKIDVGTVIVNDGPGFRREYLPFGGVKDSGIGREGIKHTIEEMTFIKQLII